MSTSPATQNRSTLLFIPTYNEIGNIRNLYSEIRKVDATLPIMIMDDASPDGTGAVLEELAKTDENLFPVHREGKQGIGSAHKAGITWAIVRGYQTLITMDADFTHTPSSIPKLLAASQSADVTIASRHIQPNSLEGWKAGRKALTNMAHLLMKLLIDLEYDATGAFRVYRLDRLPINFHRAIDADGYSFFFESLYYLRHIGASIVEVPNTLPPRAAGHSKMGYTEILTSLRQLSRLTLKHRLKVNWLDKAMTQPSSATAN